MSDGLLLASILGLPLGAALLTAFSGRWPNLREGLSIGAGLLLLALVARLGLAMDWAAPPTLLLAEPVAGLPLVLRPEPLGLMFALIASLLWPVTVLYAAGYLRGHNESNQTRFFTAFAVSIGATMGIALAGNMLTLFVFYEVLSVATYPLVTHSGTAAAQRAGRLYLGLLMSTSIGLLLPAMIWTWSLTGSLDFTPGGVFDDRIDDTVLSIILMLFVLGTAKAALMPLHRWLPAAMVAPTPVSALLHAVAVVKAGVFTILKVAVYLFGIDRLAALPAADVLMVMAGLTLVVASAIALRQDNLKARLAYSTISQLSYVVLGAMLGVATGVLGAGLHVAMHALGKITLFFCAGAIMVTAHKTRVSELDGIGRQMPWTMTAFAIGALSMIGAPPAAGFVSKWYLLMGSVSAEQWFALAVIVISTGLNAAYFMPIVYRAFFRAPAPADGDPHAGEGGHGHGDAALAMRLPLLLIIVFLYPDLPLALARQVAGL